MRPFTPEEKDEFKAGLNRMILLLEGLQEKLSLYTTKPITPPAPPPSAPPPAPKLPLLPAPPPAPKQTPAYPPPPSVEALEEVEYIQVYKPLRNIRKQPMRQKHRAAKAMPKTPCDAEVFEVFRNIIAWPPKFGGTNMRLSRDEHLDAWYTTILNTHANKLGTQALPIRA